MLLIILLKSIVLGFIAAVPVGPIGALCIERTLKHGRRCGFISGLGAATADALYSAVAVFGITVISSFVLQHQMSIRLVGGIALLWMGIRAFRAVNNDKKTPRTHGIAQQTNDYLSTFLLTLTNPATVIAFGVLFGLFHFNFSLGVTSQIVAVVGVGLGSALWWYVLSGAVHKFVGKMRRFSVETIQHFAAGFIIVCAILILASVLYGL